MSNVLPNQAGLEVNGVFYRYEVQKDPVADMTVSIRNKNLNGSGYIFEQTDDWSGRPGSTINKVVPVPNIQIQNWGDGSIDITGEGTIKEPGVFYTYQYDPCFDPQSNPSCPGYNDGLYDYLTDLGLLNQEVQIDNSTENKYIEEMGEDAIDPVEKNKEEDGEENNEDEDKQEKEVDIEEALSIANTAIMNADAAAKAIQFQTMNNMQEFKKYYSTIPGGSYNDVKGYTDKGLPENKRGRRNGLAQQILHDEMVKSQWKTRKRSK